MKLPNTPGIKVKNFFHSGDENFEITSKDIFLEVLFEGYELACIRSFNCAKRYALYKDDETRLDAVWFEAQTRVFESLLTAINIGNDSVLGRREYDPNWMWMIKGRPFDHPITDNELDQPLDELSKSKLHIDIANEKGMTRRNG